MSPIVIVQPLAAPSARTSDGASSTTSIECSQGSGTSRSTCAGPPFAFQVTVAVPLPSTFRTALPTTLPLPLTPAGAEAVIAGPSVGPDRVVDVVVDVAESMAGVSAVVPHPAAAPVMIAKPARAVDRRRDVMLPPRNDSCSIVTSGARIGLRFAKDSLSVRPKLCQRAMDVLWLACDCRDR